VPFDRREVAVLTGEMLQHCKQMLLPIIRTDGGGFFGFGEHDGTKLDNFECRFAQPPSGSEMRPALTELALVNQCNDYSGYGYYRAHDAYPKSRYAEAMGFSVQFLSYPHKFLSHQFLGYSHLQHVPHNI
jgi:hypothetical protein